MAPQDADREEGDPDPSSDGTGRPEGPRATGEHEAPDEGGESGDTDRGESRDTDRGESGDTDRGESENTDDGGSGETDHGESGDTNEGEDLEEVGSIPDYAAKYQPEDPESDLEDPAEELPYVPEPPSPDPEDIPADLQASFWWLVIVFNGALLALWLGLLFAVFEGNLELGGRLLFAGTVLFAYGYYKYRTNPYR